MFRKWVFILILIIELLLLALCFQKPGKLENTDSYVHIIDGLGILGADLEDLNGAAYEFYETTGITPAIITISNSEWKLHYTELKNYAYELYVNMFEDEMHWLIVLSYDDADKSSVDWYWENVQGEETKSILTAEYADKFRESMQKNLNQYFNQNSKYSVQEALIKSFNDITPAIMNLRFVWGSFAALLCLIVCTCVAGYLLIFRNARKDINRTNQTPKQGVCYYCKGVYMIGTCSTCPHCGAVI